MALKERTLLSPFSLFLVWVICSGPAEGSSYYKRKEVRNTSREYDPYRFIDDGSSSSHHGSSSTAERIGEEERILAALEQIEATEEGIRGLSYHPRGRETAVDQRHTPHSPPTSGDSPKKRMSKRRKKTARRTDVRIGNRTSTNTIARSHLQHPILEKGKSPLQVEMATNSSREPNSKTTLISCRSNGKSAGMLPAPFLSQGRESQRNTGSAEAKGPTIKGAVSRDTALPPKETTVSSTTPWVRRYLNSRPKDVLLPVPKDYIADGFNLAQLAPIVERIGFQVMGPQAVDIAKQLVDLPSPQPSYPIYRLALQLLLNEDEYEEDSILTHPLIPLQAIQQAAEALYLMIHARFVCSPRGLDALRRILLNSPVFGKCPRIPCEGTMLLPYGSSSDFTSNSQTCQRYCPSCGNLWNFWESKTDGCAWGPSLCYLLLMAYGHELYPTASRRQAQSLSVVVHHNDPRIFGFRIHPAATWGRPVTGS